MANQSRRHRTGSAPFTSWLFSSARDQEAHPDNQVRHARPSLGQPARKQEQPQLRNGRPRPVAGLRPAPVSNGHATPPSAQSRGVMELGPKVRPRIVENIENVALHLDMDGTLVAAGDPLSGRAIKVIQRLQGMGVPVSCNTAQSHQYLLAAGGKVFMACVNELGLRVQHADGTIQRTRPPNFKRELEMARKFLKDRPTYNILLVEKAGGFAFKFSNKEGEKALPAHVDQAMELISSMAEKNDELTFVRTDGFVDLCSSILSKRFGSSVQMSRAPFQGCFAIGAGDGATDERMFEVCDVAFKVGTEDTIAQARLTSHHEMLDVLEWIADLRQK